MMVLAREVKRSQDVAACYVTLKVDIWIKGYIRNIGACDALHAEMWSMHLGLDMTRKEITSPLIVKSNSKILLDMIIASLVGWFLL